VRHPKRRTSETRRRGRFGPLTNATWLSPPHKQSHCSATTADSLRPFWFPEGCRTSWKVITVSGWCDERLMKSPALGRPFPFPIAGRFGQCGMCDPRGQLTHRHMDRFGATTSMQSRSALPSRLPPRAQSRAAVGASFAIAFVLVLPRIGRSQRRRSDRRASAPGRPDPPRRRVRRTDSAYAIGRFCTRECAPRLRRGQRPSRESSCRRRSRSP
jgi:hypothetical protein